MTKINNNRKIQFFITKGIILYGSGEIGRIDYTGNPDNFQSSFLFGDRNKVWVGGNPGLLTGSVAVSKSNVGDDKVIATSL